jgi:alkylation response protein AidB-like acyl-CoA dehydrogenase
MRYAYDSNDLDFQHIVCQVAAGHNWNSFLSDPAESGSAALPRGLWDQLQEIGLRGLTVSADLGGTAADWTTMTAAVEALAATAVPVPVLPQIVAIEALADRATGLPPAARAQLAELYLEPGTSGSDQGSRGLGARESSVPAHPAAALWIGGREAGDYPLTLTEDADTGSTVTGSLQGVLHPGDARRLIVPAACEGRIELVVTEADWLLEEVASLDHSRPLAELTFEATPVAMTIATEDVAAVWRSMQRWVEIMVAAENVGIARAALDRSKAYATTRRQFDAPLSDNQVIRHALADDFIAVYEAEAVVHEAVRAQSELPVPATAEALAEADLVAALAVTASSRAATQATERMLQVHGGIGFTWESDIHILLKRAVGNRLLVGGLDHHRTTIAQLVGI